MEKHEQAIKQVAEALRIVDTTEKLLAAEARVRELEAALKKIALGGAYGLTESACIDTARAALQPKGE